jgi:hypothetical protein
MAATVDAQYWIRVQDMQRSVELAVAAQVRSSHASSPAFVLPHAAVGHRVPLSPIAAATLCDPQRALVWFTGDVRMDGCIPLQSLTN